MNSIKNGTYNGTYGIDGTYNGTYGIDGLTTAHPVAHPMELQSDPQ